MGFPHIRMRRLRATPALWTLVRETRLAAADFVMPLFICPGNGVRTSVESMPGTGRLSVDQALIECERIRDAGVRTVLLFGIPERKDDTGATGADDNGVVQQAVRAIKSRFDDLLIITDVCNCEYMEHGHCGVVVNGKIDNDRTLKVLARQAVSHALAGCDMVAPSDMMDGRVAALRWTPRGSATFPSCRIRQNTLRRFTARSARQRIARRASATAGATRWILPIARRHCARSSSTSKKAPIS